MELWGKYIKEIYNHKLYYNDKYFFSYFINPDENFLFVCDMFIEKPFRNFHTYRNLITQIYEKALNEGVNSIWGKVEKINPDFEKIKKMHLKTGMKFYDSDKNDEYFYILLCDLERLVRK